MFEIIIQNIKGGVSEEKLPESVLHQFVVAFIAGSIGFCTFFTTLVLIKLFSRIIGHISVFTIDYSDILLSSIGFLCLFLLSFLQNSTKKG
jgi:hypothetical protein